MNLDRSSAVLAKLPPRKRNDPRVYDGCVSQFRKQEQDPERALSLEHIRRQLDVDDGAGDHFNLRREPPVQVRAARISRCLAQARHGRALCATEETVMLQLENLDARTRGYMRAEFEDDLDRESLYISPRLSERGVQDYPDLLRAAIDAGSDITLGNSLAFYGRMKETEERRVGAETKTVRAPATAADTLAEGEFNDMYMRGLCRRALDDGITTLIVYRAKAVRQPRAQSLAIIGKPVDAAALLAELRARSDSAPAVGTASPSADFAEGIASRTAVRESGEFAPAGDMLFGPNTGLSVKLPQVAA